MSRHVPPGRTSMATEVSGTSAVGAPNQSAKASGSVHSRQTRSRGASKTRVIMMPLSAIAQAGVELVEPVLPEGTIVLQPGGRLAEPDARSRDGRCWAARPRSIRPARSSTRRCLDTAWLLIVNGSASSATEASPSIRRARIARRVGSARAAKVALSWSGMGLQPSVAQLIGCLYYPAHRTRETSWARS